MAGCSLASLANIEQGAVPRRSRVLEDALAVLATLAHNDLEPAGNRLKGKADDDGVQPSGY